MRYRTPIVATLTVLAAGISVAGCSSASSSGAGISPPAASSPATSSPAPSGSAPSTPFPNPPASTSAPSGTVPVASSACQPGQLRIALGAKSGTTQVTQAVDLTSTASSDCTLDGFPGVDLIGTAQGRSGYSWPLVRQSVKYAAFTLKPGATAHFNLTYLPAGAGTGGGDIAVTTIEITPPNDFSHVTLSWNQSVLLQDAATRPGTFISPVLPGA